MQSFSICKCMILCFLYANIRRIVPSQFKSLENQIAANFNGEPLIPRITELFGLLGLPLASVGAHGITAYSAAARTNSEYAWPSVANRSNVVCWGVSRALLLVAIVPGPSLSKACLACCSPGRGEDVVHFSGLSANRKRSRNGMGDINGWHPFEADWDRSHTSGIHPLHARY